MERRMITEVFWNAICTCGWRTDVKNDADTVGNKVRNHLMTYHREDAAQIQIQSWIEQREEGQLPATGTPLVA